MAGLPPRETNAPCLEACWVLDPCLALVKAERVCAGTFPHPEKARFQKGPWQSAAPCEEPRWVLRLKVWAATAKAIRSLPHSSKDNEHTDLSKGHREAMLSLWGETPENSVLCHRYQQASQPQASTSPLPMIYSTLSESKARAPCSNSQSHQHIVPSSYLANDNNNEPPFSQHIWEADCPGRFL